VHAVVGLLAAAILFIPGFLSRLRYRRNMARNRLPGGGQGAPA
jgi:hypothetical protein